MSALLHTHAQELGGGKRISEPSDEVRDKDIDLMTLALAPNTCKMNYLREKGHFSITRDQAIRG